MFANNDWRKSRGWISQYKQLFHCEVLLHRTVCTTVNTLFVEMFPWRDTSYRNQSLHGTRDCWQQTVFLFYRVTKTFNTFSSMSRGPLTQRWKIVARPSLKKFHFLMLYTLDFLILFPFLPLSLSPSLSFSLSLSIYIIYIWLVGQHSGIMKQFHVWEGLA